MTKEELLKVISNLPEGGSYNIDITPVEPKEQKQKVFKWDDLEEVEGYTMHNGDGGVTIKKEFGYCNSSDCRDLFNTERQAKSALVMAQLSQIMPHYCEPITDDEWDDPTITKYCIDRTARIIATCESKSDYKFLAFRTKKQSMDFFDNNILLISQYFMLE